MPAYFQGFELKAPSGLDRILSLLCSPPSPSYSPPAGQRVKEALIHPNTEGQQWLLRKRKSIAQGLFPPGADHRHLPCPKLRETLHPVGSAVNGLENINLLSSLLEIDTLHCHSHGLHFVGVKQTTIESHPNARGAKRCTCGWHCFHRSSVLWEGGQEFLLNSRPFLPKAHHLSHQNFVCWKLLQMACGW